MSRNVVKLLALLLIGVLLGGAGAYALIPGPPPDAFKTLVAPGEKDEYYAFLSGGAGGDVRVFGVPSMRLIKVIPVFNPSGQFSYARQSDGNRQLLDASGGARWGNTLYPVLSKNQGDYDGKLLFVQDEANGRVAKIDLNLFETESIIKLPNMKTARALAVDPNTKFLFVGGQSEGPSGQGVISVVDPEAFKVGFQIKGPEVSMLDGGKDGQKIFGAVPKFNAAGGAVAIYNIKAIEAALTAKQAQKSADVPVIDAAQAGDVVTLIPVKGEVSEVSVSPDGKYVIAGGKGTKATMIDTATLKPVAELDLGNEPRYTVFDGQGKAYTALYGDNKVVKWDVAEAVSAKGNGKDYIEQSLDVQSEPVYLDLGDGRTNKPTGKWLVVYNEAGADRFLDVKWDVQNAQVVDISGKDMKLALDSPIEPKLTDGVLALASKIKPADVFTPGKDSIAEGQSRIERNGKEVHVYITAKRTEYGFDEIKVKQGDRVFMHVTNIERTKDITHGFAVTEYNVNLDLPPGSTKTADFVADKPGVYYYYCTVFCSALHLEMFGRLVVEP